MVLQRDRTVIVKTFFVSYVGYYNFSHLHSFDRAVVNSDYYNINI